MSLNSFTDFCWASHKANMCHRRVKCQKICNRYLISLISLICYNLPQHDSVYRIFYYGKDSKKKGEMMMPGQLKKKLLGHYYQKEKSPKGEPVISRDDPIHRCEDNVRYCRQCQTNHTADDICKMKFKKLEAQKDRANLCFITCAFMPNNYLSSCFECHDKGGMCHFHQNIDKNTTSFEMCNSIATQRFFESSEHKFCITTEYKWNFETNSCDTVQHEKIVTGGHFVSNNYQMPKTNYNSVAKNCGVDNTANTTPQDCLEALVQEMLLRPIYKNCVVIGHGCKYLSSVYRALLHLSVTPIPSRNSKGLIRLRSSTNNLRFITLDAYLPKGICNRLALTDCCSI